MLNSCAIFLYCAKTASCLFFNVYPTFTFICRFTPFDDYGWFTKTMRHVISEEFGEEVAQHVESTHYFVDFLREKDKQSA